MQRKGVKPSVKEPENKKKADIARLAKAGAAKSAEERRRWIVLASSAIILLIIALLALLLAKPTNTLSSCGSRALPGLRDSCYVHFANLTKNASICNNIPVPARYSCISNVALLSSDPGLCTQPGLPADYRNSCLDTVGLSTLNSSVCAETSGANESACAYGVAEALNFSNATACSYINNNSLMNACYAKYYYKEAASTGQYIYCNSLTNVPNATIMSDILATTSNLSRISDAYIYTQYNITPQGVCYSNVAYVTGNQSLCSSLTGISSQLCTEPFIAPKALNESQLLSSCSSVPSDLYSVCTDGVLTDEALQNKNVSICLSLNQSGFRSSCISELAAKVDNSTYCSYISNSTLQQVCLSYINASK